MSKMYLNGSANTGKKILDNREHFSYSYLESELLDEGVLYKFKWEFDYQQGYMNIVRSNDGKISDSSLIDTDTSSAHAFSRPLGLYNDRSLLDVFEEAINSIDVKLKKLTNNPQTNLSSLPITKTYHKL